MRLALWSLAAIIAVGVAVVFVAPLFISAEDVRNRLFAEIEQATGYRLTVNGSLHISAFPTLKLVAEDVGVAQTKGAGAVDLATAKELRFGLAVAPLLSGKVQLTEVALISPILTMPEASPKTAAAEPSEKAEAEPRSPRRSGTSASTACASRTARDPARRGRRARQADRRAEPRSLASRLRRSLVGRLERQGSTVSRSA